VNASPEKIKNHETFIWQVADLLRSNYRPAQYQWVILPLTVLRRLDCVLEPTKEKALAEYARYKDRAKDLDPILYGVTGVDFYNISKLTLRTVRDDPSNIADQLLDYINGFSASAREVLDKFDFRTQVLRLQQADLLYMVLGKFCDLDLHPDRVSNLEMGYLYEELIRKFNELSNETAGDHFTPREVIKLMVNLLWAEDEDWLTKPGIVKTLCDPACGTGGMLSVAEAHLRDLNPKATLHVFGQELNPETYAVCRSDMMMKGETASHIHLGNSFTEDHLAGMKFDYLLANPPFGVEWKPEQRRITDEHEKLGFDGRFGAGLPRINDASFLFLQHMISKMKPAAEGGSRLAIVFNGSPLFNGGAGSGESEIRRWIIENDWLEGVVALPDQLFYNTGISTYFWVVTNRKRPERRGLIELVDARDLFVKMPKSLGDKRKQISDPQIDEITRIYEAFNEGDRVKIFPNHAFGFIRITIERPLRLAGLDGKASGVSPADLKKLLATRERDPAAGPVTDKRGQPYPDPELRDFENVPPPVVVTAFDEDPTERLASMEYRSAVADYMAAEVLPHVPNAWVDDSKTKVGYEIPLTRHFYKYVAPRPLDVIDADILELERQIQQLLQEVSH
jgi:type I restriction enzyme M protein